MSTDQRNSWPLGWPGISVCAALFVTLAILAGTIGTLPGDRGISRSLQRLQGEPWRGLWHVGNAFGASRGVAIVALATLIGILLWKRPAWQQDAWFLGIAIVLRIAVAPLKTIVGSPRPTAAQVRIVEPVSGYGFPSGHTLTATVLFGAIAVFLVRHVSHPHIRLLVTLLWIGGVALTGFARIWGGAHWASDVLGGALAGITIIGITAALSCRIIPTSPEPVSLPEADRVQEPDHPTG